MTHVVNVDLRLTACAVSNLGIRVLNKPAVVDGTSDNLEQTLQFAPVLEGNEVEHADVYASVLFQAAITSSLFGLKVRTERARYSFWVLRLTNGTHVPAGEATVIRPVPPVIHCPLNEHMLISSKHESQFPNRAWMSAIKKGVRRCDKGLVPRFKCRACGKFFVTDNGFARLRATPKAVVTAFDLWANDVSFRKIAHHLAAIHGVKVGKSTIERWVHRMADLIAGYADKCGPQVGEIWHADETSVNIGGKLRWTWNIMDHETRFWLASTVSVTRNVDDARKPIKQAKTIAGGGPAALVTDGQPAYIEAIRKELYTMADPTKHLVIPPMRKISNGGGSGGIHPGNNICERLQGTQRERTKVMRGFDLQPSAQELLDGFRGYFNLARPHMGLGGMTPAEKAGVAIPELDGEGRLMSVLVAAHRYRKSAATGQ